MANYTLATQKLQRGGLTGGLKARPIRAGGGVSLATAQISPGAGQVKFMPANIPQAVEDQTSKGVQHFMGTMAEAAFKYEERESTYFAKQSVARYQSFATNLQNGTVDAQGNVTKGYTHLNGQAALDGYQDHAGALEDAYNAELAGLEPRVRQKAMMDMTSVYNSAKSDAAKHNIEQFQLLEEDAKFQTLQGYQDRMLNFGGNITTVNASGMTLLDQIAAEFDTAEEAIEWVGTALYENVQSTYLLEYNSVRQATGDANLAASSAFGVARDYAVKSAQPVLQGTLNTKASNDVMSYLMRVEDQAIQARANIARANEGKVEAAIDARILNQEQVLRRRAADVKMGAVDENGALIEYPTEYELLELTPDLPGPRYQHWEGVFFKKTTDKGDIAVSLPMQIKSGITPLTKEELADVAINPAYSDTDRQIIANRQILLGDKQFAAQAANVNSHLDDIFDLGSMSSMLSNKFGDPEGNAIRTQAELLKDTCITSGKGIEQCKLELDINYDMRENAVSYFGLTAVRVNGNLTRFQSREELMPIQADFAEETRLFRERADYQLQASGTNEYPASTQAAAAALKARHAVFKSWASLFDRKDNYEATYGSSIQFRDTTFTSPKDAQ